MLLTIENSQLRVAYIISFWNYLASSECDFMGIYDRDYGHHDYDSHSQPRMRFAMPPLTPVVKWLLIINVAVFVPKFLSPQFAEFLREWFSVYPRDLGMALQPWRVITYQFLHVGFFFHIFCNMLVLYFFGPMLERLWGSRRFLVFYLVCGAMGGIVYPALVGLKILPPVPMMGASGAICGMLAAGAILFPNLRVYVLGIFPMTLMALAIVIAVISLLMFMGNYNAGGGAAHLAGMAAGVMYVKWKPWRDRTRQNIERGTWDKKVQQQQRLRAEVDRILAKVHKYGVNSLTRGEKSILKKATRHEQGR